MSVVTGILAAPKKLLKGIGNRYRIAYYENRVDDMISPEKGLSGWVKDKVEDVTNFLTMGAVARFKDGIKTKGYGDMTGKEIETALLKQYSEKAMSSAEKNAAKQEKEWAKLQSKMDKLTAKDEKVSGLRARAANADAMLAKYKTEGRSDAELGG